MRQIPLTLFKSHLFWKCHTLSKLVGHCEFTHWLTSRPLKMKGKSLIKGKYMAFYKKKHSVWESPKKSPFQIFTPKIIFVIWITNCSTTYFGAKKTQSTNLLSNETFWVIFNHCERPHLAVFVWKSTGLTSCSAASHWISPCKKKPWRFFFQAD